MVCGKLELGHMRHMPRGLRRSRRGVSRRNVAKDTNVQCGDFSKDASFLVKLHDDKLEIAIVTRNLSPHTSLDGESAVADKKHVRFCEDDLKDDEPVFVGRRPRSYTVYDLDAWFSEA